MCNINKIYIFTVGYSLPLKLGTISRKYNGSCKFNTYLKEPLMIKKQKYLKYIRTMSVPILTLYHYAYFQKLFTPGIYKI